MGKGDKRSFRGKLWRGSYGVTRLHVAASKRKRKPGARKGPTR
ncbi:MAG: 30S ribosomal protein THX [Gammaproteobacteria bacterium]